MFEDSLNKLIAEKKKNRKKKKEKEIKSYKENYNFYFV